MIGLQCIWAAAMGRRIDRMIAWWVHNKQSINVAYELVLQFEYCVIVNLYGKMYLVSFPQWYNSGSSLYGKHGHEETMTRSRGCVSNPNPGPYAKYASSLPMCHPYTSVEVLMFCNDLCFGLLSSPVLYNIHPMVHKISCCWGLATTSCSTLAHT